jgi:hypothetical protein
LLGAIHGAWAGFFPSQGSLGDGSVHGKKVPPDAMKLIVANQRIHPELLEHSGSCPLLEAPMRRRMVANARGVQGAPLASGARHKENGVHRSAVIHTRIVAAQRMELPRREKPLHLLPQLIGNTPAVIFNNTAHNALSKPSTPNQHQSRLLLR